MIKLEHFNNLIFGVIFFFILFLLNFYWYLAQAVSSKDDLREVTNPYCDGQPCGTPIKYKY